MDEKLNRRRFLKGSFGTIGAASLIPITGQAASPTNPEGERISDKWFQLGTGTTGKPTRKKTVQYDVVVIGAGMAGCCAAVAAARSGAKTLLVNDRPVLGGNGSSEIRVTVNGVNHMKPSGKAQRETGIIEEMLLENRLFNPQESYPVWDHILYDYVTRQDNLEVMVNTMAIDAVTTDSKIVSAICWQATTEMEYTINAKQFIDCSGDGLLAATAGALYRTGREGKAEFDETYAPDKADGWQMGASVLMQGKDMGKPTPYTPPSFAIQYDPSKATKRKIGNFIDGYWWVELGSENDIIADQEENRHKLMGYLHGVWDYIKNSGKFPEAANYALDWVGSLPGRRESRRFIGDYILSEKDLTEYRHFPDAIGYGGWSLDEHCPGGILNTEDPPSFFHHHFEKLYEVPYRSLYSKNISNLSFAGRNASQTHIALSSTRIQSTCALQGQAVGTSAAMCVQKGVNPRQIAKKHIVELQEQLIRDDVFIPNRPANDSKDLAKKATITASSTSTGDTELLTNGISRDDIDGKKELGKAQHWASTGLPAEVQLDWDKPIPLSKLEIKCDTNVTVNINMRKDAKETPTFIRSVPPELLKTLSAEAKVNGKWINIGSVENNRTRLIKMNFDQVQATAVRIIMKETYGHPTAKLFEVRCYGA